MSSGSSGSLRFKICLSKQEMEPDESLYLAEGKLRTSTPLYTILNEIHRLCAKKDHKGIFANPVTEAIAPDYFSIISDPMDFGTIYTRIQSRNHYLTAGQYLCDLRLVCTNAMRYNPPDTVYFQKAHKMLIFVEKQMSRQNILKLSKSILREGSSLSATEMVDLDDQKDQSSKAVYWSTQTRQSQFFTPPQLREESTITINTPTSVTAGRKRHASSSSSISSTGKAPRYPSSPPSLVPEVDEKPDSPRKPPVLYESEETIDLECDTPNSPWDPSIRHIPPEPTASIDDSPLSRLTLSPSSTTSNSPRNHKPSAVNTLRRVYLKNSSSSPAFTQPARKPVGRPRGTRGTKDRHRGRSTCGRSGLSDSPVSASPPPPPPPPERSYAEDVWTFTDSLTDRTPPEAVRTQVATAARRAKAALQAKYGRYPGQQRIVYIETTSPGKLTAKVCPNATSFGEPDSSSRPQDSKVINYPPAMVQLLTGRGRFERPSSPATPTSSSSSPASATQPFYHGLIEQMTSPQVATLHALSTLRYNPDEPIAMNIHGPLAIFDKDELAQMCDAYGGDISTMEYVLSMLSFVEPLGPKTRAWAHRRLNEGTAGYHGQMLAAFAQSDSHLHELDWIKKARFTLDPEVVMDLYPEVRSDADKNDLQHVIGESQETTLESFGAAESNADPKISNKEPCSQTSVAPLPADTSIMTTAKATMDVRSLEQPHETEIAEATPTHLISEALATVDNGVDEEDDSFDILSAALSASGANLEPVAVGIPNLAASVCEIAQISALTAAISPIQVPSPSLHVNLSASLPIPGQPVAPVDVNTLCSHPTPFISNLPPLLTSNSVQLTQGSNFNGIPQALVNPQSQNSQNAAEQSVLPLPFEDPPLNVTALQLELQKPVLCSATVESPPAESCSASVSEQGTIEQASTPHLQEVRSDADIERTEVLVKLGLGGSSEEGELLAGRPLQNDFQETSLIPKSPSSVPGIGVLEDSTADIQLVEPVLQHELTVSLPQPIWTVQPDETMNHPCIESQPVMIEVQGNLQNMTHNSLPAQLENTTVSVNLVEPISSETVAIADKCRGILKSELSPFHCGETSSERIFEIPKPSQELPCVAATSCITSDSLAQIIQENATGIAFTNESTTEEDSCVYSLRQTEPSTIAINSDQDDELLQVKKVATSASPIVEISFVQTSYSEMCQGESPEPPIHDHLTDASTNDPSSPLPSEVRPFDPGATSLAANQSGDVACRPYSEHPNDAVEDLAINSNGQDPPDQAYREQCGNGSHVENPIGSQFSPESVQNAEGESSPRTVDPEVDVLGFVLHVDTERPKTPERYDVELPPVSPNVSKTEESSDHGFKNFVTPEDDLACERRDHTKFGQTEKPVSPSLQLSEGIYGGRGLLQENLGEAPPPGRSEDAPIARELHMNDFTSAPMYVDSLSNQSGDIYDDDVSNISDLGGIVSGLVDYGSSTNEDDSNQ